MKFFAKNARKLFPLKVDKTIFQCIPIEYNQVVKEQTLTAVDLKCKQMTQHSAHKLHYIWQVEQTVDGNYCSGYMVEKQCHDRMPPVQQVKSWVFLTAKYSTIRGHELSTESISTHFQTLCCFQFSFRAVSKELHGKGFHGLGAACKPYITKHNP